MPDPQPVKKPLYPDVFFVKHLGADDHQELLLIELKSNKYASQYTYFLPTIAKQNVALFAKQWFPCNRHFFDILWLYDFLTSCGYTKTTITGISKSSKWPGCNVMQHYFKKKLEINLTVDDIAN